jgi:hypothetical protein
MVELISRYNAKLASPEELREIEQCLESGQISLTDLGELNALDERLQKIKSNPPSARLDSHFYDMLAKESKVVKPSFLNSFFHWPEFAPRLAFGSVTLVLGLVVGLLLRSPVHKDEQIEMLGQEVSDLKELMMLSLLEKESATERLKAVSLSNEMDQASQKVTGALLQTLNSEQCECPPCSTGCVEALCRRERHPARVDTVHRETGVTTRSDCFGRVDGRPARQSISR